MNSPMPGVVAVFAILGRLLRRCAVRVALLFAVAVHAIPSTAVAAEPLARGSLFIVGGGDTPIEVQERFVMLAGGAGKARIAVFPMASTEYDEEAAEVIADFESLGAEVQLIGFDRDEAADSELLARLGRFSGFWFLGGDQVRLASALVGTPALALIATAYRDGAVVGGTSAGAAVMSISMLTGKRKPAAKANGSEGPLIAKGLFEVEEGFGFLPGAIVDQHFLQRARYNRLLSAVLEQPRLIGVGIDEGTAIMVRPDGRWEVLGESYVKIFDARRARISDGDEPLTGATGIRMHLLPAQGVFDPATGKAFLPGG